MRPSSPLKTGLLLLLLLPTHQLLWHDLVVWLVLDNVSVQLLRLLILALSLVPHALAVVVSGSSSKPQNSNNCLETIIEGFTLAGDSSQAFQGGK